MEERNDWKKQAQELDNEIDDCCYEIPLAYWHYEIPVFPGTKEAAEAIDNLTLPSKEEAIKILENKSSDYYDVLRARLCVALVKKRQLLQANLSPKELDELRRKNKGQGGWFIPDIE